MKNKFTLELKKRAVPTIIKQMNDTNDLLEIRHYQDMLISSMLGSLAFLAVFINIVMGLYMGDPFGEVLTISIFFLAFSVAIDTTVHHVKSYRVRIHMLSSIIVGLLSFVIFVYYGKIGTVIWSAFYFVLLLSIIRLDRIMFAFIAVSGIILNNVMYYAYPDQVIVLDTVYYVLQINLLIGILIIGLLWNKIYQDRFKRSHKQFVETLQQKEELTQLYEEIVATEEELREQNNRLNEYNSEIKANQKKLNFMAYNDTLTNLPNRKNIIETLNFFIDLARKNATKFAVVFVDLDGFKKINDTHGHHIGDKYLIEVANRLNSMTRENDTVGRFGGDEFAILIQNVEHEEKLYEYVHTFMEAINEEICIEGARIYASASFGIAVYPDDAEKIVELFKAADAAMYKAKSKGKNNIQFFKIEMKDDILDKLNLEHELVDAYKNDEFFLVYQPQVALNEAATHGFEALIRWDSPKRGLIGPVAFIPILEDMGLIIKVGAWVMEESIKKIVELNKIYSQNFYISVNISVYQLKEDDFVSEIIRLVEEYGINGEQLELEITESVLIEDVDMAVAKLKALKEIGIKIALDDFGTGYASLNYLNILPLDALKIDKSFIWDLDEKESSKNLVKSIIDIVHNLDITVVAEGVENNDQLNYLIQEECDHVQGYLISRPVNDDGLIEFINQNE